MVFLWRDVNSGCKLKGTVLTIQDQVLLHGKTIHHLILGRRWGAEMVSVSIYYVGRL